MKSIKELVKNCLLIESAEMKKKKKSESGCKNKKEMLMNQLLNTMRHGMGESFIVRVHSNTCDLATLMMMDRNIGMLLVRKRALLVVSCDFTRNFIHILSCDKAAVGTRTKGSL